MNGTNNKNNKQVQRKVNNQIAPKPSGHKTWLILGISIAVIAVLFLFLYSPVKEAVFGKAAAGQFCVTDRDCDEGLQCLKGACEALPECSRDESLVCDTGLPGVCSAGTKWCTEDGTWGNCIQDVPLSDEICDGLDNDCDGSIDNNVIDCPSGQVCYGGACCTPTTCIAGTNCGTMSDGCGRKLACGECLSKTQQCNLLNNVCEEIVPAVGCGDGACNPDEDCGTCPDDCGVCPAGETLGQQIDAALEEAHIDPTQPEPGSWTIELVSKLASIFKAWFGEAQVKIEKAPLLEKTLVKSP